MIKYFIAAWFSFASVLSAQGEASPPEIKNWIVYYSNQAPVTALFPFQLAVLDGEYHPNLEALREKGIVTLGYLNLGELEDRQPLYKELKSKELILEENPNWKGSYYVDLRNKKWVEAVIEDLIPPLLFEGFDGIFLDTVDNAEFLEEKDPVKYKGMKAAAAKLVKTIRLHFPKIPIMMNRGYAVLPDVGNTINMVLGESVYSTYNFDTKNYEPVSEEGYKWQVDLLQKAKADHPKLQVFTLDYWNPNDKEMYKKIYKIERDNGFIPYVSTIELHNIYPEP